MWNSFAPVRPARRSGMTARLAVQALEDRTVPGFLAPVTSAGAFGPTGTVADFNTDGRADLVSYDLGVGGLSVRLGNGNGTFQAPLLLPGGPKLKVGDVNADGKPDLVTGGSTTGSVAVLLGNGDGTFRSVPPTFLPSVKRVAQSLSSFELGDLNNDARLDIVATGVTTQRDPFGSYRYSVYLNVLTGRGNGSFRGDPNPTLVAETYATTLAALQDFDGDRNLDALVSNGLAAGSFLFFGRGDGTFKNPVPTTAVVATDLLTDVNGDGKADLVAPQPQFNSVSVSLGNGDGSFQRAGVYAVDGPPSRVTVGDFNSDGRADLATVSVTTGTVSVLLSNGDGTFQSAGHFAAGPTPGSVAVGDFNGDGWIDLVVGNTLDSGKPALSVLVNDGSW